MESHCCISYLLSFSERRWTSFLIFSFFSFSLSSCSVSRFFCFVQLDHFLWYCFILVGSFPFVVTSIWLFFFTYFINFGILLFLRHTMETATYSSSWLWLFCHCDFSPVSPVYLPFHLCMHMYMPSVYFGFVTTHAAHFLPVSPLSSCIFLFSFFSLHSPSSSISFSTNFPFHCSYTFSRIPFIFSLLSRPPPLPSSQYFLPLHTSSSFIPPPMTAALARGRGWSRRTWAACCQCVTSGWTPASCTRCPCWPSARTSWWCGSSSVWPISWPNSAAAERPQAALCWEWLTENIAHVQCLWGGVGILHADSWGFFWNCATVLWVCMKFMHANTVQHVHTVPHWPRTVHNW